MWWLLLFLFVVTAVKKHYPNYDRVANDRVANDRVANEKALNRSIYEVTLPTYPYQVRVCNTALYTYGNLGKDSYNWCSEQCEDYFNGTKSEWCQGAIDDPHGEVLISCLVDLLPDCYDARCVDKMMYDRDTPCRGWGDSSMSREDLYAECRPSDYLAEDRYYGTVIYVDVPDRKLESAVEEPKKTPSVSAILMQKNAHQGNKANRREWAELEVKRLEFHREVQSIILSKLQGSK